MPSNGFSHNQRYRLVGFLFLSATFCNAVTAKQSSTDAGHVAGKKESISKLELPTGSKLFLENKGTSDESQMFTELLGEKLGKDETSRNYVKPGFPIVDKKENAAYTLKFIMVMRENEKSFMEKAQEHARVIVWLLDTTGTVIWEHNYDCVRVSREPARECYQHISDDLKSAQVNAEGKRAGMLGWRK
jgi:hypothetical protein